MTDEVLLAARGIRRTYGARTALHGLDLELKRGDVLGFLGQNGAGKSTTLQILAGALAPSAGEILVCGHSLTRAPAAAKARLGFLPEQPPLYRDLRVDDYLAGCARLRGVARAAVPAAVARARAHCGLEAVGARVIGHLSKGYQQRVGIAQALVHDPAVVILDEPTSGLDPAQIREVRALIAELGRERAVIVSTHILPEVRALATRLLVLHQGRVVHDGRVTASARLRARLRRPPPAAALAALPGVSAVEQTEAGWLLATATPEDSAEALVAAAAAGDWGLIELDPADDDLERLFLAVTGQRARAA
ncbi:MAG: ABC transporter ATP-binding protein [Gammaproteobacteria bacterium]